MIELPKEFTSGAGGFSTNPFTYKQIQRNETAALYSRSRECQAFEEYEVFRVKTVKKGTLLFQTVLEDDKELYPGNSAFGISAWSFVNKESAIKKFNELTNAPKTVVTGGRRGRKPILMPCKKCSAGVPKTRWTHNKEFCDDCK